MVCRIVGGAIHSCSMPWVDSHCIVFNHCVGPQCRYNDMHDSANTMLMKCKMAGINGYGVQTKQC